MSLSRILNDDPPSSLAPPTAPLAASSSSPLPAPSRLSTSPNVDHGPKHHSSDVSAQNPPGPSASEHEQALASSASLEQSHTPSKRRKKQAEDSDYRPPSTRLSTRRASARLKHTQTGSPAIVDKPVEHASPEAEEPTEEERRLASSDLDDCEDLWFAEISDYMLETQKRRKLLEGVFNRTIADRNVVLMQTLAQRYADTVDRIPLPPPPGPPASTKIHELRHYDGDYSSTPRSPLSEGGDVDVDETRPTSGAHGLNGTADTSLQTKVISRKGKGKAKDRFPPSHPASDLGSTDVEFPVSNNGRSTKKRKVIDVENFEALADDQQSVASAGPTSSRARGKGKQLQNDDGAESVAGTPKGRKRAMNKRKFIDTLGPMAHEHLGVVSNAPSVAGDATPSESRAASPALTVGSGTVFELDEVAPPLKKAKKVDDATMLKRLKTLEESQQKVWKNIARREMSKIYKYHVSSYQQRQANLKRVATLCSIQARKPYTRAPKAAKEIQAKSKRLMREMLVFWKKNEKEERDVRRREQKEALDRAKMEEEKREAARQAKKLEFLISQTELYSHFVGNKLKTSEIEGEDGQQSIPTGAQLDDDPEFLAELNFDDEDHTNLHRHARRNAQEAVALARSRAEEFDAQAALERKTNDALKLARRRAYDEEESEITEEADSTQAPLVDLDSDELNFQNPTSLSGPLTIGQPRMLMAQLKEYQLKGLNWLATLYEQGINGILADEMGLGKTVQSISLLAYLAETHDIWGPFLVVAPASTLHNWQQEITRFVPKLKALPYWGNVKDRATLRKFWSKKEISYNEDAPFHVLITSYQLVTQDQQYFQRVKWQYMILDEAQNIKNAASVRWKTLLSFHCRNRLLLTGTPIQNSMQELWALLHFIMPSLFDSHDEFNEWFSKDIENAAENKGSRFNEHQLRRLHMILKPFMLRRVKKHVQNELSDKIEIDIYVDLSARQRAMYRTLLSNVSVADLLAQAANLNDVDSARTLMNLVMQFRKVCNHPELFERADVVAPFSFAQFGQSGPLNREGDFIVAPYSTRNPIEFSIPRQFVLDHGLVNIPGEEYASPLQSENSVLRKLMNIWTPEHILRSLQEEECSSYSFLRFVDTSPQEVQHIIRASTIQRQLFALQERAELLQQSIYHGCDFAPALATNPYRVRPDELCSTELANGLPSLGSISLSAWSESCLSRPVVKWFVPSVVAPPISMHASDRPFVERQTNLTDAPLESLALFGAPDSMRDLPAAESELESVLPGVPLNGLLGCSPPDQVPLSTMRVPEAKSLIYDSAKLARLDSLLQELKAGDHRVLIYFQMTRMMDLMEEYLIYRQYKYLRLDGSSKLEDRRDMVIDWQTRPDIFIFILSTRAGGLGINLTAADTVVFYDHDWNPSNDAQAMDRAHRLGQTRQVTVYRLITKGTIDERIIQLARVKKDVQDIVVGNKTLTDVAKPSEIVQLLLNEDQLANLDNANGTADRSQGKNAASSRGDSSVRALWTEEGDDFFGGNPNVGGSELTKDDDGSLTPSGPSRGRNRRRGTGDGGRGRGRGRGRGKNKKLD